jgi:DNA-binding transcriptional LysR family regulator
MNVTDIRVFGQVAATGSFNEAGKLMGLSRSAVSKSVSRLEEALGVELLNRSPRKTSLTEAGRELFRHSRIIDEAVDTAIAAVSGADKKPEGNVSCSLPTSLGAALMPAIIRKFRSAWPNIGLNLHFDERQVDLVGSSFDVAIRVAAKLEDSNLLSRRLGSTRQILVASPAYLTRNGVPAHVNDLPKHRCIGLGTALRRRVTWRFNGPDGPLEVPIDRVLTTNNNLALILSACLDEGILWIPELFVGRELAHDQLQEILPQFSDPRSLGVFAVYPTRKPPTKVRVFIDFVADELVKLQSVDRWAPLAVEASPNTVANDPSPRS